MFSIPDTQPIIGSPSFGYDACMACLQQYSPKLHAYERSAIAAACLTYGTIANIGDIFILMHMAKETAWFASPRWTKSYNPGGLGSTNDGAWGHTFRNPAEGIAAMVAHQLNYATKPEAMTTPQLFLSNLDPRRDALLTAHGYGSAPRWIDLSQKWGVITDPKKVPPKLDPTAYGMSIIVGVRKLAALKAIRGL